MAASADFFLQRRCPQKIFSTRVISNKPVAQSQYMIWLKADEDLPPFELGNFCMLTLPDLLDPLIPRPFAICESRDGMYGFIYRVHGKQTRALCGLSVGARVDVTGPLGRGLPRERFQRDEHIFIAGGVGYASILPLAEVTAQRGIKPKVFYGVRTDLEVIRRGSFDFVLSSDDGSVGHKGRLHEILRLQKFSAETWFYVCGPTAMMKACAGILPPERTFYFLEETMGCGFGICVGCVVPIKSGASSRTYVKSCLEGPIFLGSDLAEGAL